MKSSLLVNTLTFCVIALGMGYAIIQFAVEDQQVAECVQAEIHKLHRNQAELSRDLVIFANSDSVEQAQLSLRLRQIRDTVAALNELLTEKSLQGSALLSASTQVVAETRATLDIMEHIRSELAVLRNAITQSKNLVGKVESGHSLGPDEARLLFELEQAISMVSPSSREVAFARLVELASKTSKKFAATQPALVDQLRVIGAQIEKIYATSRFVESDFRTLTKQLDGSHLEAAEELAAKASQEFSNSTQSILRMLMVLSAALVAFVSAGIWQFRAQSVTLAQLNKHLESRVQRRTQQLADSKEFLGLILDSLPSHICILDAEGNIIQTNAMWDRFASQNPTEIGVGTNYLEVCRRATGECRESAQKLLQAIEKITKEREGSYEDEYACHAHDDERWFQVSVSPLTTHTSGRVVVSHSCITQRVQAENALKAQKEEAERLALVAKYTDNAVVITDANSQIEWVNEGYTRITGYTLEEVKGRVPGSIVYGKETSQQTKDYIRSMLARQKGYDVEIVNYSKSGRKYWLASEVRPICDEQGKVVKYIAIESEITRRKKSETERSRLLKETQNQKALLDTVMRSVDDGIIAADEDGRFLCFNRAAEAILERRATSRTRLDEWSEEYGLFELDGTTPIASEDSPLCQAIRGESLSNRELLVRRDSGDVTLSVSATPLKSGTYHGGVITLRDVTEYKRLELKLSQAQKLESIGQLAAGIAHEINTPMQFVGDNIEFLSESSGRLFEVVDRYSELLEGDTPISWEKRKLEIQEIAKLFHFDRIRNQFPDAIEECREGVQRTVKIVKAMKDFSHPGNKSRTLIDINEAIESTVAISRNRWKYAATMQLDLSSELPLISVYAAEINQVLLNLVVNAADAIAEHQDGTQLGLITFRTEKVDDCVRIHVEDDGCGMPDEIKAKIFDPFFTTKDVGKGTGQGLAITNDVVVKMHGGTIDVQSEVGSGTTFSINLPIRDPSTSDPSVFDEQDPDASNLIHA